MSCLEHWRTLVQENNPYPRDAEITSIPDNKIRIDWKLGNNPNRQNKRSKTIIIKFSEEFISDYKNENSKKQTDIDNKIISKLRVHHQQFDPDHNNPIDVAPPLELIIVTSNWM